MDCVRIYIGSDMGCKGRYDALGGDGVLKIVSERAISL
jgi:hypothetical protein